mmetsp:Transcript_14173/g.30294  ORF Transcript_14173/g.30294 Transcript_14173/m.30294 type:complete len:344 (-) Transcript_14173:163-1194(-)
MTRIHILHLPQRPPTIVIEPVKIIIVRLVIVVHRIIVVDVVTIPIIRGIRTIVVVIRGVIVRVVVLLVVAPVVRLGRGIARRVVVVRGGRVVVARCVVVLLLLNLGVVVVLFLLALVADVVVVVPGGILFGEGHGDFFGVAALAAVEGRAERYLVTQIVTVDIVAVPPHLLVAVDLRTLLVAVHDELELGRGVRVAMLTSDLGVEGIFVVGRFLQHDAIQKSDIAWERKVLTVIQRLVIEVGSHVMRDAHDEGPEILEVTIEGGGLFEELKFDHVSVVIIDATDRHDGNLAKVHILHVQIPIVAGTLVPFGHGGIHSIVVVVGHGGIVVLRIFQFARRRCRCQ